MFSLARVMVIGATKMIFLDVLYNLKKDRLKCTCNTVLLSEIILFVFRL